MRLMSIGILLYLKQKGNTWAENVRNFRKVENWRTAGLGNFRGHIQQASGTGKRCSFWSPLSVSEQQAVWKKSGHVVSGNICFALPARLFVCALLSAHCSAPGFHSANRKNQSRKQTRCWNKTNYTSTLFTGDTIHSSFSQISFSKWIPFPFNRFNGKLHKSCINNNFKQSQTCHIYFSLKTNYFLIVQKASRRWTSDLLLESLKKVKRHSWMSGVLSHVNRNSQGNLIIWTLSWPRAEINVSTEGESTATHTDINTSSAILRNILTQHDLEQSPGSWDLGHLTATTQHLYEWVMHLWYAENPFSSQPQHFLPWKTEKQRNSAKHFWPWGHN